MKDIKPLVFLPPFLLCIAVVALNYVNESQFVASLTAAHRWVSHSFGWLVSLTSFGMLVLCGAIAVSPFGKTILGGPAAKPLLTRWQMFAVVLTTNIAAGILFWGTFEPLSYLSKPPLKIAPNSPEAAQFAISTVYLHWTLTPYAIASVVGLMFAFAYFNMKKPFSLGAPLSPLLGRYGEGKVAEIIDAICLYSLVTALAAALGGASLLLGGGINHVFGIDGKPSSFMLAVIIAAIMGSSVAAAVSGVTKGIRMIADLNTIFLIGFLALVLFLGPTRFILDFAVEGLGQFLGQYFQKVLFTGAAHGENWPHDWTQMLYSAFFAWAPIMGVFLGRIAYGYSVRAFLFFNVVLPGLFTGLWMGIICGAVVHMELFEDAQLSNLLDPNDPTRVLFTFLGRLPLSSILIPVLLFTAFLSFVTTADGNTEAMSNISSKGISPEHSEASFFVKLAWGTLMAVFCWVMVTYFGLDGIRMLSNLGGFPALFLCLAISVCAIRVAADPDRYDRTTRDEPIPSLRENDTR